MEPQTTNRFSPLHGKTIVVTRPRARAGTLSGRLRTLGAEVLECPCIETSVCKDLTALQEALAHHWDWAAFTSPTGVHLSAEALRRLGPGLRALHGMRLAAVGKGTAGALASHGLSAGLMPGQFDGGHLAEALLPLLPAGGSVLILRGAGGDGALPRILRSAGIRTADIPVYETHVNPQASDVLQARLTAGTVDLAAFASASAVRGFVQAAQGCRLTGFPAACIGPLTAKEARAHGMRVKIAEKAAVDALVDCILEEFANV